MRDELEPIWQAVSSASLPDSADELFGSSWSRELGTFRVQETYILDYKDRVPDKFSDPFGASIVRLALGFYNAFGGLVVFGVEDRTLSLLGTRQAFDIESFNRVLTDVAGLRIECLTRDYHLTADGRISVLLVPRRGFSPPVRLKKQIGNYRPGHLWVRDRHEVLEADSAHLPILYSARAALPSDAVGEPLGTIFCSLPPSPATMHKFIGREALLGTLWDWFVFGDQPRLYLHGPGGSGKSTLAFEFARVLADTGSQIGWSSKERLDYVLFISGKETELNPLSGRQQSFSLRQFDDAKRQFAQILVQSGQYDLEELIDDPEVALLEKIRALFQSYSGLLVIDDIDALSRRGVDTGEEPLFIEALRGTKRTRILYTLRSAPAHALRSALAVPGLSAGAEFNTFMETCCRQFEVALPEEAQFGTIARETSSLPLLVETVVGLRRVTSTFREAIHQFKERGDDDARRYLYQREYDQLARTGKSREVLAALSHLKEPVGFTTLVNLLSVTNQAVTDALSECGSIFLTTVDNRQGETLYQLAAPSIPFIRNVSERLSRADQIKRRVELVVQQHAYTAAESALILRMERMVREGKMDDVYSLYKSFAPEDPVFANPKVLALTGQALSALGPTRFEQARECFRAAEAMKFRDIFMMRSWFAMELQTGYGISEASRLCRNMIDADGISSRYKSEFWSKFGLCQYREAMSLLSVSQEKAIPLLRQSVEAYLEALWVGRHSREISIPENLGWMERPLQTMLMQLRGELDVYMDMIGSLTDRKHDVSIDGAMMLLGMLSRVRTPADERAKAKLAGLCRRTYQKLDRTVKESDDYPGFRYLMDQLDSFQAALSSGRR